VAARQTSAEVQRVAAAPFAAAVPRAVLAGAAQVSEAPPSAASAVLHAVRDAAAKRRVGPVLHVDAATRAWEQPVAASRAAVRQPLEPFRIAMSAFGLAVPLAALVTAASQRRIVAWPDRTRRPAARRSATAEHRKPVPSPERLRQVLASTHRAPAACLWCRAPAVRSSSGTACRSNPDLTLACRAAPLSPPAGVRSGR
jgi:hypothetical protein